MGIGQEPRELNSVEAMIWNRLKSRYAKLTKSVIGLVSTFELGATFQQWITQNNLSYVLLDNTDQTSLDDILNRYNIIGRLITGAEVGKYNVAFENQDVIIGAPPGMPNEQYAADIYPANESGSIQGLDGILLVVGIIAVGLIVGAIVVSESLDFIAKRKDQEFRKRILETDKEMSKQPPKIRNAWNQLKKDSSDLIEKTNKVHGSSSWLGSLGIGSAAGIVVLLIGLIVASQIAKR